MTSYEAGNSHTAQTKEKIRKTFTQSTIVRCVILLVLLTPLCYNGWQEIKVHYSAAKTYLHGTGHEPRFTEFDENDRKPLICEHDLTIGSVV